MDTGVRSEPQLARRAARRRVASGVVITYRDEHPDDVEAKAALFRAARSRFAMPGPELRAVLAPFLDGTTDAFYAARLAFDGDGLVGAATVWQPPTKPIPHVYEVEVVVAGVPEDPFARPVDSELWDWVSATLPADAVEVRSSAYTDQPDVLAGLRRYGFTERTRAFRSTQRVADVDLPDVALPAGWRIQPLDDVVAALGDAAWAQLNDVAFEARSDIPHANPPARETADEFRARINAKPTWAPDRVLVARDDVGRLVGYTELLHDADDPKLLHVGLTGLARSARRKGIALALKVAATNLARDRGVERVDTWNDAHNERMLAINTRLGFVADRTHVELARPYPGPPGPVRYLRDEAHPLGDNTFSGLDVTTFAILDGAAPDADLVAGLLEQPQYAHDYASPLNPLWHFLDEPVHGRWLLTEITPDRFRPCTGEEADEVLRGWAGQYWGDEFPEQARAALATASELLRRGTLLRLDNPGQDARSPEIVLTGSNGFHEFLVVDRERAELHVVVATDD